MPILRYRAHYPLRKYQYGRGPYRCILIRRYLEPSSRKVTVCHGCGDRFKPQYKNNVRCEKCQRMQRVLQHQKYRKRGARGYVNHTCPDCRWALKRGLQTEPEK